VCYEYVCLSVCLLTQLENHMVELHLIFFYMLPMAVARFCSEGIAISYVLPVLWMTSRFHITALMACHVNF